MEHPRKLYRSRTDRVVAGVCGGLGAFFDKDATLFRLMWALIIIFTGVFPGLLGYFVAALLIPDEPVKDIPPTE